MLSISSANHRTSFIESAVAGGFAGAFTRAVAQPLDVLKIRFQLQLEPIKNGSRYSSIPQAVTSIIREEGIVALWSGHIPAQFLSISYGVLQFSSFEMLTQVCQDVDSKFFDTHKHTFNFCNGSIAATIATVASYPFDTIRTRLIAEQKTKKVYKGFMHAFTAMVKTEGPVSLFKGLVPTFGQIAPHAGMQFAVYKLCTEVFSKMKFFQRNDSSESEVTTTFSANMLSGSIAGLVAKTAIYPFDLVKKRLQIQGFQQHRDYFGKQMYCTGLFSCVKLTINEEGFMALFKGYGPSMLKAVMVTALHFAAYDEIRHIFIKMQVR